MTLSFVAVAAFVLITCMVGLLLLALSRRLQPVAVGDEVTAVPGFPGMAPPDAGPLQGFDIWFQRTCYFSGLGVTPVTATMLMLLVAITLGGLVFVLTSDALATIVVCVVGLLLSLGGLIVARQRTLRQFQSQFPAALDLFSRAIRAGESVEQAMQLLSQAKIGEPAQTEFRRCSRHLEMGLSLSATMSSLCERLDLLDVRIFSGALAAHRDGGGNLAVTIERLAAVIRDRVNYRRQLRAVTGASRVSVYVIAGLGPVLFAWLFLFNPDYGVGLWNDSTGRMMLIYAIISELIGLTVVGWLLKADY